MTKHTSTSATDHDAEAARTGAAITQGERKAQMTPRRFTDEEIASVTHEANRKLREILGEPGDNPTWAETSESQRASVINGVEGIRSGRIASPRASHNNWLKFKENEGWKYGPVKDEAKKEHPCFLPYDELPAEQRMKDLLFGSIVRALGI